MAHDGADVQHVPMHTTSILLVLLATVCVFYLLVPIATRLLLGRWSADRARRLDGRIAVVTGASAGVGRATALQLAQLGATVVLGIRSDERGRATEAALREEARSAACTTGAMAGRVEYLRLDLGDLASVRQFAATVKQRWPCVDILVNNAGLNNTGVPKSLLVPTTDGMEEVFAVNYIGHFLLTLLLLPALLRSAEQYSNQMGHDERYWRSVAEGRAAEATVAAHNRRGGFSGPRIVNLSSVTHRGSSAQDVLALARQAVVDASRAASTQQGGGSLAEPTSDASKYSMDPLRVYAASKLAMTVFTNELSRRLQQLGGGAGGDSGGLVAAVAVNPGMVNTDIARRSSLQPLRRLVGSLLYIAPEQAAAPTMFGITEDYHLHASSHHSGDGCCLRYVTPYWGPDCLSVDPVVGPYIGARYVSPSAASMDSKLGATLWDISLEVVASAAATHISVAKDDRAGTHEEEKDILSLLAPVPVAGATPPKSSVGRAASSCKED